MTWFKIVSWHLGAGWSSRGGMEKLLCGKWARRDAPRRDAEPMGEKTCESCLRNFRRNLEKNKEA